MVHARVGQTYLVCNVFKYLLFGALESGFRPAIARENRERHPIGHCFAARPPPRAVRRNLEIGLKIEIEAVLDALNSFSSSVHPTGAVLAMRVRPQPVATIDTMCPHGQLRKADATVGIKYDPVGMAD